MSETIVPRVRIWRGWGWRTMCIPEDVAILEAESTELAAQNVKLIEALKEIITQTDGRSNSILGQARAYAIARAAIAKAKGEQP